MIKLTNPNSRCSMVHVNVKVTITLYGNDPETKGKIIANKT
jgi:hypothetical protein